MGAEEDTVADLDGLVADWVFRAKRDFVHVRVADQATAAYHAVFAYRNAFHGHDATSREAGSISDAKFRTCGDEEVGASGDDMGVAPWGGIDLHVITDDKAPAVADFDPRKSIASDIGA